MNSNATERRWTRQERLASLLHQQANAGRSANDRADAASVAPIPTQTRAALRAIEARRVARIDPRDLTDLALARYAAQWAGTARGDDAVAEFTRRADVLQRAYDTRRVPVRVRETIRHGDYVSRLTVGGSTLADAVASSLGVSPYNHLGAAHVAGGDLAARIVAELSATGHAEFGWADYDVVTD